MKLKHYLIASEQNDYKPWIVTPGALGIFCLIIWSLRLIVPTSITLAASSIDSTDLMKKINDQRTQRFIDELTTNAKLITAANGKASDMLSRSYFAHIDPDGNYIWPRIEATGYTPFLTLGENLAMDFDSADRVMDGWMNSPNHRANLLNEKFKDQGLASVAGKFEPDHNTIMVVSLFGALINASSPPPTPAPTPKPTPPNSNLNISNDVKVAITTLSGLTTIDVNVIISGNPTLVTAQLKGQSISLIAGKSLGEFIGRFTFDQGEDLAKQHLFIEARDKNGAKATLNYPVDIVPASDSVVGDAQSNMPVSNEARIIYILRIIFGIFAAIYMGFLAIDAYILHRAKIKREGIRPASHLLVFALLAAISLFV